MIKECPVYCDNLECDCHRDDGAWHCANCNYLFYWNKLPPRLCLNCQEAGRQY